MTEIVISVVGSLLVALYIALLQQLFTVKREITKVRFWLFGNGNPSKPTGPLFFRLKELSEQLQEHSRRLGSIEEDLRVALSKGK